MACQFAERGRLFKRLLRSVPSVPVHLNESVEPFFIVGSGRCGTTLMRRLLQASPEVHIPPETWALDACIRLFTQYQSVMPWDDMVHLLLGRHVHGSHRWFDQPPIDLRHRLLALSPDTRSLARLLDELYRYHGCLQEATFERWGDKTPRNVDYMNDILRVFPHAQFIHLLRDGVDVAHSWSKQDKYTGDVVQPAQRWKNAVLKARSFATAHPDHFLEVRYEHFVRQPEKMMQRIGQFIGLAYDSAMLNRTDHFEEMNEAKSISHYQNAFASISTDSIGKGRRNLNAEQKRQVDALIGDDLVRFGYERAL